MRDPGQKEVWGVVVANLNREAEEGLVEKGVPEWGFRIWNYLQEE